MEMNVTTTIGKMETIGIGLKNNVDYDWSTIVEVISDSSQKDQDELEEYFPTAYPILQEIFDFYSGGGDTITLAEFCHALHMCKIHNTNRDLDLIKNNVEECKKRLWTGGEGKHDDIDMGILSKEEVRPGAKLSRRGSAIERDRAPSCPTFLTPLSPPHHQFLASMILVARQKSRGARRSAESMSDLIESYVATSWIDGRSEDRVKKMMDSSKVRDMMDGARGYLKELYDKYAQNEAGVMTAGAFAEIMKDAGLLTRNPGERPGDMEERTRALAENCFFGAQGFPPRQLELPELVFSEFLEATCRLCGETLGSAGGPAGGKENFDKFQLGVDALMDLKRSTHK